MTKTELIKGKVKTVFTTSYPDKVLIQYEDKVTDGNGRKVDFPQGKGNLCCEISSLLFQLMEKRNIKTHYIRTIPERIICCKKVDIIPIEVVIRNIATGSIVRQTTIEEGTKFKWPVAEFYLKDDEKDDPLLTTERIIMMGYNMEDIGDMELLGKEINLILQNIFEEIGLTLVDLKLEFGYDINNKLLLADELSPDSMRLWKDGESFDKDLFRKGEGNIVDAYQYILTELTKVL